MIYGRPPRAYAQIKGRWTYLYTHRFYEQVTLFGETIKMVACTVNPKSKDIYHIPLEDLYNKKPKPVKKSKQSEGA